MAPIEPDERNSQISDTNFCYILINTCHCLRRHASESKSHASRKRNGCCAGPAIRYITPNATSLIQFTTQRRVKCVCCLIYICQLNKEIAHSPQYLETKSQLMFRTPSQTNCNGAHSINRIMADAKRPSQCNSCHTMRIPHLYTLHA
jgi:hypothetical protein